MDKLPTRPTVRRGDDPYNLDLVLPPERFPRPTQPRHVAITLTDAANHSTHRGHLVNLRVAAVRTLMTTDDHRALLQNALRLVAEEIQLVPHAAAEFSEIFPPKHDGDGFAAVLIEATLLYSRSMIGGLLVPGGDITELNDHDWEALKAQEVVAIREIVPILSAAMVDPDPRRAVHRLLATVPFCLHPDAEALLARAAATSTTVQ